MTSWDGEGMCRLFCLFLELFVFGLDEKELFWIVYMELDEIKLFLYKEVIWCLGGVWDYICFLQICFIYLL